tara:strand:- start:2327 stop:2890 length:564 start_codon:yes stop_codon:yes gene_type:complete
MNKVQLVKIIKEELSKSILEKTNLIDQEKVNTQINIGKKQLLQKLKKLNVPKSEVLNIFKKIDDSVNSKLKVDGSLTVDGIVQYIQTFAPKRKQKGFRTTTNVTMRNYPALIMNSGNQVLLAMSGMGGDFEKAFEQYIDIVKASKDSGQLSKEEYKAMVTTLMDKSKQLQDRVQQVTKQMNTKMTSK